jgi:ABC-type phosphate transport system substrate-binding protein
LVNQRLLVIVVAELVLVLLGVYGYTSTYSPAHSASLAATEPVTLTGAGATLSYPLLSSVAQKYQQSHPRTAVNYQPLGSIAGISQLTEKTIDFCVTYPPMTQAQRNKAPGLPLHIPESISAGRGPAAPQPTAQELFTRRIVTLLSQVVTGYSLLSRLR